MANWQGVSMKRSKLNPEEANEKAGREGQKAWWSVSLLRHAATATWPPKELIAMPTEVRGKVIIAPSKGRQTARQEWDFRARFVVPAGMKIEPFEFLEDAELLPCYEYEVAREDRTWIEEVRAWRGQHAPSFSALLDLWCQRWRTKGKHPSWEFYVLWPEWPDVPYLSLPPAVRHARLQLWTGRAFKVGSKPKRLVWDPPPLPTVSMSHLFGYRGAFWKEVPNYRGPYEDAVIGKTITFNGEKHKLWRTREFVAFDLSWDDSNESMIERFRVWVEQRRKVRGIKERELRGTASFTRELRRQLCALGAWRLIHKARMKVASSRSTMGKGISKDVHTFTERIAGKALYKDPLTWKRNLDRIAGPLGILPHEV